MPSRSFSSLPKSASSTAWGFAIGAVRLPDVCLFNETSELTLTTSFRKEKRARRQQKVLNQTLADEHEQSISVTE